MCAEAGLRRPVEGTEETLPPQVAIKQVRTLLAESLRFPGQGQNHHFQPVARLSFCVTPSYERNRGGTGILTCFPSTTPFGLALGTD